MAEYRGNLAACRDMMRAKRFAEAVAALTSLGPKGDEPRYEVERRYLLGICLRRLGRYESALAELEYVRKADAGYKDVLKEVSKVLAYLDPSRAETYLTGALQEDPDDKYLWVYRVRARLGLGRYEEALEDAMEALRIDPDEVRFENRPTLWHTLFRLWERKVKGFDQERLRAFFEEVVALHPRSKDAWQYKAKFLREIGDWQGAAEAYERALALAPADLYVLGNAAWAYEKIGRMERVFELLYRIQELDPDNPGARAVLWCLRVVP